MRAFLEHCIGLLAAGRADEAVRLLEDERTRGGGPALFTLLGYALFQANRIADARRALADGLERFPFDPRTQEAMARMRWLDGDGDGFADDFLAAITARPGDSALRFKCADLLRLAGKMEKAEQLLRDGLARTPMDIALLASLGALLDETDQLVEALAINGAIAKASPDEPAFRLQLAHTLLRMGRADAAMAEIVPVREARPDVRLAISHQALALKQLGDPRFAWLCDFDRHLKVYDIAAPAGFSSVADFNTALGARLRELQDATAHPLDQSLRGGSQTSQNLIFLEDPLLQTYFATLDAPVRDYIANLGDDPTHPMEAQKPASYKVSGCWSVLLRANGFHVNHTHPNGWISSSYYVSLPPVMGGANQEGWIKFGEPRFPIPGCGVERVVEPKEGRLVLFPSYMWHGTIPFSSGTRLTAPFDVVPA